MHAPATAWHKRRAPERSPGDMRRDALKRKYMRVQKLPALPQISGTA
jgi:hypothetical protein